MKHRRTIKYGWLLLLGCIALAGANAQEAQRAGEQPIDYRPIFRPTLAPGFNVLALMGGSLEPSLNLYATPWGTRFSLLSLTLKGNYGYGFWYRYEDGSRIDPQGPDAMRALWRQLYASWTLSYSQGLIPHPEPVKIGQDLLSLSLAYTGIYSRKNPNASPDSFVYAMSRPDAGLDVLENQIVLSLDINDYKASKLFNTREGFIGSLSLVAAPREFFNDAFGLSDYYKLKLDVRNYIPIVKKPLFSMYLYENLAYDIASGNYLPMQDSFSAARSPRPVRGAPLFDGLSHLSHQLELRMSFPNAFDSGVMPGFNIYYDCGLYDDYDYVFNFNRFAQALGMNFVMHMDSMAILPISAQLDLQFGLSYDLGKNKPSFNFELFFPNENQL